MTFIPDREVLGEWRAVGLPVPTGYPLGFVHTFGRWTGVKLSGLHQCGLVVVTTSLRLAGAVKVCRKGGRFTSRLYVGQRNTLLTERVVIKSPTLPQSVYVAGQVTPTVNFLGLRTDPSLVLHTLASDYGNVSLVQVR